MKELNVVIVGFKHEKNQIKTPKMYLKLLTPQRTERNNCNIRDKTQKNRSKSKSPAYARQNACRRSHCGIRTSSKGNIFQRMTHSKPSLAILCPIQVNIIEILGKLCTPKHINIEMERQTKRYHNYLLIKLPTFAVEFLAKWQST